MDKDVKPAPRRSSPRPRLGRGLSTLIPTDLAAPPPPGRYEPAEATATAPAAALSPPQPELRHVDIPLDTIAPNPYQPRSRFPADDLAQLMDSIRQQGILQPLIVAKAPSADADRPYLLVAGERRLRAARQLGLAAVPCIVRDATPQQMLEWALVENIHRSDLNPIERAEAYRQYVDRFALTQAEAGQRLGQPRATVANYLRLLDLPEDVRHMVADGRLSFGHAKVLAGLNGRTEQQRRLAARVVAEALSVRQLERAAAAPDHPPKRQGLPRTPKPPYLLDLEHQLRSFSARASPSCPDARSTRAASLSSTRLSTILTASVSALACAWRASFATCPFRFAPTQEAFALPTPTLSPLCCRSRDRAQASSPAPTPATFRLPQELSCQLRPL
jgi:ParB family chromosome partitioning protein